MVGLPNLQDWLETYRVRTSAQSIASDLQLQRMRAVSRNTRFTLAFDQANGTFTLWQGDPVNGYTDQISPEPVVLPVGVTFTDPIDDPIELTWRATPTSPSSIPTAALTTGWRKTTRSR